MRGSTHSKLSDAVRHTCLIIVSLFALSPIATVKAQLRRPATWGGDIFSRPRLTGDWGGLRDDLGKKGVVLDIDLLMTPQINVSGGRALVQISGATWTIRSTSTPRRWGCGRAVSSSSRPIPASAAISFKMSARSFQ